MSIVSSFDQTFEQRLRAKVKEAAERNTESVMRGLPPDYYQRALGVADALRVVIDLCDEVRKAMLHE